MNNYLLILFFSLSFSWLAQAQQDSTRSLFIYYPRFTPSSMNVYVYIDFNLEEEGLKYNSEERWAKIKQQPLFYIAFVKENSSNDSIYRVYDVIPICEEESSCKDCTSFGHSLAKVFADKKFYFDLEWTSEKEKKYYLYEHGGSISRFTLKLKLSEELPWPFRPEKE